MANLRELRKHAGELGIEYTKETKKEELMEKIAAAAAEKAEAESSAAVPEAKTPVEPEPPDSPVEPETSLNLRPKASPRMVLIVLRIKGFRRSPARGLTWTMSPLMFTTFRMVTSSSRP